MGYKFFRRNKKNKKREKKKGQRKEEEEVSIRIPDVHIIDCSKQTSTANLCCV